MMLRSWDWSEDMGCLNFISKETKELFVTALRKEVEQSHAAFEEDEFTDRENGYNCIWNVCYHLGNKTITRTVHFDAEAAERIKKYIEESASNTYDYPYPIWEPEKLNSQTTYNMRHFADAFTVESMKQLYACLYEETKPLKMSLYAWLGNNDADVSVIDTLYVDFNGKLVDVPISRDTPKTL